MRKSKLMKALLVFGMSVVTATSMIGIAACNPDSGNNGGDNGGGNGDGHQHSYDDWNRSATEHWHECVDCSEEADRGAHKDDNHDNKCDVCSYELAHTFKDTWTSDAGGHWHEATCHPVNDGVKPHVDDGVAAGSTKNDGICDVCGYENVTSQGYKDFVANKITEKATKVLDNTFFIANELPLFTSWSTAGIYASDNGDHKVDVSGGKALLIKPNTAPSTCLYVDWGNVVGSVVEGFFKISDVTGDNDYTSVQFTTSDGTTDSELFGFRTNKGNAIKYRLNGSTVVEVPGAPNWNSGATAEGNISVYYKYDVSTNKITVKINDTAFVTDLQLNGTALKGIKFSSGSNAYTSNYAVDDIIVIKTPVDVTAYKEAITANSTAERGKVTAAGFEIGAPMQTADQALQTALSDANATTATLTEAYNTWFANLLVVYGNAVKNKIMYTDYLATDYDDPKNEDAAAYTAAVEKLGTDLKAAKTVESITAAYKAADTTIKALGNDDYWTKQDVVVTVVNGKTDANTLTVKEGDQVTKAQLDALVDIPSGKKISGYYTDADCTAGNEVTLPLTVNAATSIYAKLDNNSTTTIGTFDGSAYNEVTSAVVEGQGTTAIEFGGATGLKILKGTGSDFKLGKQNNVGCIQPGGSVGVGKNAIVAECGTGKVTVTISYFQGSAGRYIDVLDSKGNVVATSSDMPTTVDKAIKTATLTFNLSEAGTIYIGSHSSGLYISSITVTLEG